MEDEYALTHRRTIAYDILKDTANALQARYVQLGRVAEGAQEQELWKARSLELRERLARVDPRDLQRVTELTEWCRAALRSLQQGQER